MTHVFEHLVYVGFFMPEMVCRFLLGQRAESGALDFSEFVISTITFPPGMKTAGRLPVFPFKLLARCLDVLAVRAR